MDGNLARVEGRDALRDDVADDDLVAQLGEGGRSDQADPARADDAERLGGHYCGRPRGLRPLAMAIIVSFESRFRSVFTTQ